MWQLLLLIFAALRGHECDVSENVTALTSKTTFDTETNSTTSVDHSNSASTSKPSTTPGSTTTLVNPMINKTVCYDIVGCFDNYPPFDNADYDLPMSPEEVGTQFLLFTRQNLARNETQFINYTDIRNLTNSYFDAKKKTKFIIHGFSNSITTEWIYEMKDELLKAIDANVLVVTWGPGAEFPNYARAVANTRMVGTQIKLLLDLMMKLGVSLENVHLIGHSLGAHISGYTGYILNKQGLTLGRITVLRLVMNTNLRLFKEQTGHILSTHHTHQYVCVVRDLQRLREKKNFEIDAWMGNVVNHPDIFCTMCECLRHK